MYGARHCALQHKDTEVNHTDGRTNKKMQFIVKVGWATSGRSETMFTLSLKMCLKFKVLNTSVNSQQDAL